ncbi:MAG: hypothetical protein ACLRWQ_16845 [Flavonifractor plautii]
MATDLTGTNTLGFSGSYETDGLPHQRDARIVGFNCTSGLCRNGRCARPLRGMDRSAVSTALLSRHAQPADLLPRQTARSTTAALADHD